ncbi:hypothetical protein, partial [Azotobacter beijerinckii]|uniref:hypothetical protein n=1 Tax=Azotobacter beijerinckii TaxID=170623 RepID=UPI00295553A9
MVTDIVQKTAGAFTRPVGKSVTLHGSRSGPNVAGTVPSTGNQPLPADARLRQGLRGRQQIAGLEPRQLG